MYLVVVYMHILSICTAYLMHMVAKGKLWRSVWVKVEYRRPFSGGSIGDHAQLSPTPIGDHVQLFPDHAQLRPLTVEMDHIHNTLAGMFGAIEAYA